MGFERDTSLVGSWLCRNPAGYGHKDFLWGKGSNLAPLLGYGLPETAETELVAHDCLGLGLTEGYGLVGFVGVVG